MSRYKKAIFSFVAMFLIIICSLVIIFFLVKFLGSIGIIRIGGEVELFIKLDDAGTKTLSFLKTEKYELNHMGILGSLFAKNDPDKVKELEVEIEKTLEKISGGVYRLKITGPYGEKIYELGEFGSRPELIELGYGLVRFELPVDKAIHVSSGYGEREDFRSAPHKGVDFSKPEGSKVYAVHDGRVLEVHKTCPPRVKEKRYSCERKGSDENVCKCNGKQGNYVKLEHREQLNGKEITFETEYLHLKSVRKDLNVGDVVKAKEVIGYVGNTGYTKGQTGLHLDFRINVGGKRANPCPYFIESVKDCSVVEEGFYTPSYEMYVEIPLPGGVKGQMELVT